MAPEKELRPGAKSAFCCVGCHLTKVRKWLDLKIQDEAWELEQLKLQCLARGSPGRPGKRREPIENEFRTQRKILDLIVISKVF